MDLPRYYQQINIDESTSLSPSMVKINDTAIARYFKHYLFERAQSTIKFDLPLEWAQDYFSTILFGRGYIAVLDTERYGVICQHGTASGLNIFFEPSYFNLENPLLRTYKTLKIGEDCEVIKLQNNWQGLCDIVNVYGNLLALACEGLSGNLLNSKSAVQAVAKNKAGAEAIKKGYDKVSAGEPLAVYDSSLFSKDGSALFQMFNSNLAGSFISDKLLVAMRTLTNMFDEEIGIPNSNIEKKAQVLTDEVNANNVSTYSLVSMWLDNIQRDIERVNSHYGLKLKAELRFPAYDTQGEPLGGDDE